jgi:hypothetical protein
MKSNSELNSYLLFIISVALCILAFSCKVTFVPGKSQVQIDLLNKIQSDDSTIFANPDLSFAANESALTNVNNEVDSLLSFDQKRKKKIIIHQDIEIQTVFNSDATEWQSRGTISHNTAAKYRDDFKSIVDPRMVSETFLK